MTKHRRPLINVNNREQQFAKLLTAMGLNEMGPLGEYALKAALEQIALDYQRSVADPSKLLVPKRVRQLRAAIAKVLALHKAAGSDTLDNEIELASLQLLTPTPMLVRWRMLIADHRPKTPHGCGVIGLHAEYRPLARVQSEGLQKAPSAETGGRAFFKADGRVRDHHESQRAAAQADIRCFVRLARGVEQNIRASNANINTIAAELAGAGPKKSKANRRPKT
ncbi:hypothetical protein BRDID11002_84050 [Bradyrhizobium diazoefficiens]